MSSSISSISAGILGAEKFISGAGILYLQVCEGEKSYCATNKPCKAERSLLQTLHFVSIFGLSG